MIAVASYVWLVIMIGVLLALGISIQSHPGSWLHRSWEQPLNGASQVCDTPEEAEALAKAWRARGSVCVITVEPSEPWIDEPYDRYRVTRLQDIR